MFTKKFEVQVSGVLYSVYASIRLADEHCKKCKRKFELTKLVSIDEIHNEDMNVRVDMLMEYRILGDVRLALLKESMFQSYCEPHVPNR